MSADRERSIPGRDRAGAAAASSSPASASPPCCSSTGAARRRSRSTTGLELAAIRSYQTWISPWLQKGGVRCRFTPSCSHYAAVVLARDGFVAGNFRALGRLVRCGPWTGAGTADPP